MHVSVELRVPCVNFFFLLKWVNVNNNSESRMAKKKKRIIKKEGADAWAKILHQKKTFNFSEM